MRIKRHYHRTKRRTAPRRRRTCAFSLIEVIAATALLAGALAPSLAVMRDAMSLSREAARRNLLANYGVLVLEYSAGLTMQNWASDTTNGNLASEGYPTIRYQVTRSDAPANGGLTGRLMHIQVAAYDDANGNSVFDASEKIVRFRTKVAKLTTYVNEPN